MGKRHSSSWRGFGLVPTENRDLKTCHSTGRSEGRKRRWRSSPSPCPASYTDYQQVLSKDDSDRGSTKSSYPLVDSLGLSATPEVRTLPLGPMI